jgi:hypothetical protein
LEHSAEHDDRDGEEQGRPKPVAKDPRVIAVTGVFSRVVVGRVGLSGARTRFVVVRVSRHGRPPNRRFDTR